MPEGQETLNIDRVLRAITTANRSLRLYPASSPMRLQSIEAVVAALDDVFSGGADSLQLAVAREGFVCDGEPVAAGVPGGQELADDFRSHGVSAIRFAQPSSADDILKLLELLGRPAEELRAAGTFAQHLAEEGVGGISVTGVRLTVTDTRTPDGVVGDGTGHYNGFGLEGDSGDEGDDGFGAADDAEMVSEVVNDASKLGEWLTQAARGDRSGLESGLMSLVQAVGTEGGDLASSMSVALRDQDAETRDALLGLAMEPGPFRDLMGDVFSRQSASEIAGAILGGAFGRNMLSLSMALACLPLDQLDDDVRAEVHAMLPAAGRTQAQAEFLDHMIAVRQRQEPEPSLVARDQTYLAVARASAIRPEDLATASRAVGMAASAIDAAGVRTMFRLLDEQQDPAKAREGARGLVLMVARLLASKQLPLAEWVLTELASRSERVRIDDLLPLAATPDALDGLIDALLADPSLEPAGSRIVRLLGEPAVAPLVSRAIGRKAEGLRLAERMLGKRMMEPLNAAALQAEWFQLAPIVTRLTIEGDSRCAATLDALVRRPDPAALKEIISGLSAAGGPLAQRELGELVRHPSPEIAGAAARALAKSGMPGSGAAIAARIQQLDLDNGDFELGRELINALARTPDRVADEVLERLASRRSLMKRGRFNDVQATVAAARQLRGREAVGG